MILRLLPASAPTESFVGWIEFAIRAIEGLAVAIIALSGFGFRRAPRDRIFLPSGVGAAPSVHAT